MVDLLVAMGYGRSRKWAAQAIGQSGDEGIAGILNEGHLSLDVVYIQAKRWENPVGRPEIQKFVGALQGKRARKGIVITTSSFTKEAIEYASRIDSRIVLIDGRQLVGLMIMHNGGVMTCSTYEVKQVDEDYCLCAKHGALSVPLWFRWRVLNELTTPGYVGYHVPLHVA